VQSQLTEEKARHQCDLLEKTWDTLNGITADLRNRGLSVDAEIYTSLRSTKTLITLCKTHPRLSELMPHEINSYLGFCVGCCGQDVVTRVKCELRNVEDRLIIQAMNELGNEYALNMQQKTVKTWEPLQERIVANIENLDQAIKVEKDVLSAYQRVIEENISYWIAVEEDIVESYTRMANQTERSEVKSTLTKLIEDSKDHIEVLGSIRENFRKIAADQKRHGKMLEELTEKKVVA